MLLRCGRRAEALILPLVITRREVTYPVDDQTKVREHDVLTVMMPTGQRDAVSKRLLDSGFLPVTLPEPIE